MTRINGMFTVTGQVMNTFVQPGSVNKDTGEIGPSTVKIQLVGQMPVQGGDESRFDLITLSVKEPDDFKGLVGKTVRIPLGFFAPSKGSIIYFIPKGGKPELVSDLSGNVTESSKPIFTPPSKTIFSSKSGG